MDDSTPAHAHEEVPSRPGHHRTAPRSKCPDFPPEIFDRVGRMLAEDIRARRERLAVEATDDRDER